MARRNPRCILFIGESREFPGQVSLRAEVPGGIRSATEVRFTLTRAGFKPGDRVIVKLAPAPAEPKP